MEGLTGVALGLATLRPLVDAATWQRLERATHGQVVPNRPRLAALAPGDVGVIEATVVHVHPVRTYQRKRGGTGELCRVTLADASGEADLVLWDEELRHARQGVLVPGATVRLRGASVKPGYRSGIELGLGSAVLEPVQAASGPGDRVEGVLLEVGETRVVDGPPVRFQAEAVVHLASGPHRVVLEGDLLLQARSAPSPAFLHGLAPHPVLAGWLLSTPQTRFASADTLK